MTGPPVTLKERKRIAALYRSGLSICQIAPCVHRSRSTVYHALDEEGVPFHRKRKCPLGPLQPSTR